MDETVQRFSQRTGWNLQPGEFAASIAAARAAGRNLLDLSISNPTVCGFDYDSATIFAPLKSEENVSKALVYDPEPRGMRSAREAVSRYYRNHGALVDADSVILTTSTSEAYSFLFRLLCDSEDEVLIAQPSYPLFDFLATLDDVVLKPYPLFYDFGWWIDFAELERRIGPRSRAILVVHPNNPTGHWTHKAERERLEALCVRHGLALIVDEVFLDYPISSSASDETAKSFTAGPHPALTFVLSGISKIAALPQMKVAWLAAFGPQQVVADALGRLEVIADTFLSMNAPAQLALPSWLGNSEPMQTQVRARIQANLQTLQMSGMEALKPEAGWSSVARLPCSARQSRESVAAMLLEQAGVIVHPGAFYGLSDRRFIVLSLITPVEVFQSGVLRMCCVPQDVNLMGYPQL